MDLFKKHENPLIKRVMPSKIENFIGQAHLLSENKPLHIMIKQQVLHSMIFFGPPATGKTSLAELLAKLFNYNFIKYSALTIDSEIIRTALRYPGKSILFIDEFHRLNKPKQDMFLGPLERGEIILIGATTENPYFIIQPALRSRLFIYEFVEHTAEDLRKILFNAIENDEVLRNLKITFSEKADDEIIHMTNDARKMLNILDLIVSFKKKSNESEITINKDDISVILEKDTAYSSEEGHFDTISAFIKSVRGSDIDAAIYYLALMIENGEDPLFIARRLIVLASEDVGLAYPEALSIAVSAYTAIEKIGMPEGRIVLGEVTCLLAGLPKSNSAYLAIDKAIADIKAGVIMKIPNHLKNNDFSSSHESKGNKSYKYPHDFENHFVKQQYTERNVSYYKSGLLGFEKTMKSWLDKINTE